MNKGFLITIYLISVPLIIFGTLLLVTILGVLLLGGPREPPTGMTPEEFSVWTESGRWFWEAILQGAAFVAFPLPAIWFANRRRGTSSRISPT